MVFKMKIEFRSIGIIHTPFSKPEGMPIQPAGAAGATGTAEVLEEYQTGLKDLDGFSHIVLLYYFHRSRGFSLHAVPYLDSEARGLFATRAPRRPNPVGLSVVQLDRVENGLLHIRNVDMLDGTPLLDIKPYVPEFDAHAQVEVRTGWLENARKTVSSRRADDRFK
jgi:tRNA-Thr(GGU) m(6)t(6)A37 methyltransferase TsaA